MKQPSSKIFLADERGSFGNEFFHRFCIFNYGTYYRDHRQAFGKLVVFNDEMLDAGHSTRIDAGGPGFLILVPIIGALAMEEEGQQENLIAAGQAEFFPVKEKKSLELRNPFSDGVVRYLHIQIRDDERMNDLILQKVTYDVNKYINQIRNISPEFMNQSSPPFIISIGKFSGRGEYVYKSSLPRPAQFLFVVEGAFEAEGVLMHAGDGLALPFRNKVEMESLSNNAILLSIELPS